jgi:hypothetical protein
MSTETEVQPTLELRLRANEFRSKPTQDGYEQRERRGHEPEGSEAIFQVSQRAGESVHLSRATLNSLSGKTPNRR